MKDLILATSVGYSFEQLYPFLQSLKETKFDGEIVLFVGNTSPSTMDRLRSAGITLVSFSPPFKRGHKMRNPIHRLWPLVRPFVASMNSPEKLARWSAPFHNLSTFRYLLYYRFLKSKPSAYRNIFLTDLRDVVFQQTPFLRVEPGKLRFYVEELVLTLGTCPNDSRWIRSYFGEEILRELSSKPLICSGTTLGDYPSIMTYLEKFILTLRQARSLKWVGIDQGVHNYLAYTELQSLVTLCPNRDSEVLTMGLMPKNEPFPRNEAGKLIDRHGDEYAVLHQFDRHENFKREILSRYQAKV